MILGSRAYVGHEGGALIIEISVLYKKHLRTTLEMLVLTAERHRENLR